MTIFLQDADVTIHQGDVLDELRKLPGESVHMCCTSPPFYGLRDYGTGTWEGGEAPEPDACPGCAGDGTDGRGGLCGMCEGVGEIFTPCAHETVPARNGRGGSGAPGKNTAGAYPSEHPAPVCGKCGARRVDQQIGLEATPDLWVARLVEVFREVRRVLRADGVCFIEIGDSYASGAPRGAASRGTAYTAPRDSQGPGSACPDPDDGRADDHPNRSRRTSPQHLEAPSPVALTGRDSAPRGCEPVGAGSAPRGAQQSTRPDGAHVHRAAPSSDVDGVPRGTPPRRPRSSLPGVLASVHRSACTNDRARPQPSSADHIPDTEPLALALLLQTIAARPVGSKQLMMMPALLALALQCDGWIVRSDICWSRPNPMPESVTDRPTKSHSYVFLLAKQPRYFYDAEAIRDEITSEASIARNRSTPRKVTSARAVEGGALRNDAGRTHTNLTEAGRNRRTVWTIATQPYPEAHFATWPEALCRDMILAGTSERGVCPECGAPWERVVEVDPAYAAGVEYARERRRAGAKGEGADGLVNANAGDLGPGAPRSKTLLTTGWQPTCECHGWLYRWTEWSDVTKREEPCSVYVFPNQDEDEQAARLLPAVCLDPFGGSGTTAHVARKLGRRAILIELSADYCRLATDRLAQQSLLAIDQEVSP